MIHLHNYITFIVQLFMIHSMLTLKNYRNIYNTKKLYLCEERISTKPMIQFCLSLNNKYN